MRVLVVDDNRAMRMLVSRALRSVDAISGVLEADSAEDAIERLVSEPVNLVLCDWNMGGMTGLELLQALRTAGWDVPFAFVTLESSDAIRESALAAGAAFVVVKPFSVAGLVSQVEAFLAGVDATVEPDGSAGGVNQDRPTALASLLEGLVRAHVTVARSGEGPARQAARWVAEYVDPDGREAAVWVVETPIASGLGAALIQMSPAIAAEWAESGTLPDALTEGFHEVANVLAKVVRVDGARCILRSVDGYAPGEKLPQLDGLDVAPPSEHFRVTLVGYGVGLMSLVTL